MDQKELRIAVARLIAREATMDFLTRLEENMASSFKQAQDHVKPLHPVQHAGTRGKLQQEHISNSIFQAATASGFDTDFLQTNPKGYNFVQVQLESFTIGGARLTSKNWKRANYAMAFGSLNKSLAPRTLDLFGYGTDAPLGDRLFLAVMVAEIPYQNNQPAIYIDVPHSDLNGYHFRYTLEEIKQAAEDKITPPPMLPSIYIKKRLDDAEKGTQAT